MPTPPQIVLSGAGKHFCTGIDVGALMQGLGPSTSGSQEGADCQGRSRWRFRCGRADVLLRVHAVATRMMHARPDVSCLFKPAFTLSARISSPTPRLARSFVFVLQEAMTAFEACPVPVIAAVHGHCVGAGGGVGLLGGCRWGSGAAWLPFQQRHLSSAGPCTACAWLYALLGVLLHSAAPVDRLQASTSQPMVSMLSAHPPACRATGIDMITACDIRLATESAVFCVKASQAPAALWLPGMCGC